MKKIGIVVALIAIVGMAFVSYLIFSPVESNISPEHQESLLQDSWESYRESFITDDGRTLDKIEGITTSEGQSYSMLRAVWIDDKKTFDLVWEWTQNNLRSEREDKLFDWLWGQREDGSWGTMYDRGGGNTASDAGVDIALALLLAERQWDDKEYRVQALEILHDIWELEVLEVDGRPYLLASDVEMRFDKYEYVINPSYCAPYAFRIFQQVDMENDWEGVAESCYDVIDASLAQYDGVELPPDWMLLNTTTGEVYYSDEQSPNYTYDALRTPWRLAIDVQWFGTDRSREILEKMDFLGSEWERNGLIWAEYTNGGAVIGEYESGAMYGTAIGYFEIFDTETAQEIYDTKLLTYPFGTDQEQYYESNWAWFGMALHEGKVVKDF
jgi:endo-1,4-beta-D-glucanase Y